MTIRRYEQNGGERYYSQPYIKPTLYDLQQRYAIQNGSGGVDVATLINGSSIAQQTLLDQQKIAAFKEALARGNGLVYKSPGLIDPSQVVAVVDAVNGNGEKVEIALDENGEPIAEKKAPLNIVPIALAAAAAWFFLM